MSNFLDSADWSFPVPIHYGPGRLNELGELCKVNGINRPLLVTDIGSKNLPFIKQTQNVLNSASLKCNLFSGISPNPLDTEIQIGKAIFEDGNHDAIIAIGGGSGMDGGKAISLIANNKFSLWDFDNDKAEVKDIKKFPHLICIPTTSGTGAETESTAMVTHSDLGMKLCVWHPNQKPNAALLDPKLTLDLPDNLTAWTGVDALVHAVESYTIDSLYSVADGMAIQALTLIGRYLKKTVKSPHDLEARGGMLLGSCLAGISFKKGLGLVHAISHMVGAIYDSQHGLTNAILLPPVLRFNEERIRNKSKMMNFVTFSKPEGYHSFYNNICNLLDELEINKGLGSLGVTSNKTEELAIKASRDAAAKTNPRKASVSQLKTLILESLENAR
ncbi:MAG: iron-containing alcohol dehydrogenase [Paracoccaceae bacterium]|nr:iron-containing alcohol dehydrogenase [Paracoccaceae bacterium]